MEQKWIFLLLLGIVGVLYFLGFFQNREGFQAMTYIEKRDLYHKQQPDSEPKPIYANAAAVAGTAIMDFGAKLNAALHTVTGLPVASPPEEDYSRSIFRISVSDISKAEKQAFCNGILDVNNLPIGSMCGWLHIPDTDTDAKRSIALIGSAIGPDPELQVGGRSLTASDINGNWFWPATQAEKDAAIRKEQEKKCMRIKTCGAINANENCAFDTTLGHGVFYDRQNPTTVASTVITHPNNCPVNYQFCPNATTADEKRKCALELMDIEGIAKKGWLQKEHVQGDIANLIDVVHERAKTPTTLQITIDELTGVTKITLDFRKKLAYWVRLATSYDRVISDIAQMMVYGALQDGRIFALENYYRAAAENTADPSHQVLAVDILQRAWRKAGCQPAGTDYPTTIQSGKSYLDKEREYQELYESMYNTDNPPMQAESTKKCLGIAMSPTSAPIPSAYCNERGIEYFLYDSDGASTKLIGHFYSTVGLLADPRTKRTPYKLAEDMKTILTDGPSYTEVSWVARTMVSVPTTITMLPSGTWSGSYTVLVNKVADADRELKLSAGLRNLIEIKWQGSRETSWGSPVYEYINMNLDRFQLLQESKKPMISLDFYKGGYLDSNRIVELTDVAGGELKAQAFHTGVTRAAKAARGARIKIRPAIRNALIQIVSVRVFIPLGENPTIFYMEDVAALNYNETAKIIGSSLEYLVQNGYETRTYTVPLGDKLKRGTWQNIQIAFYKNAEDNTMSLTVYLDQTEIGRADSQTITNETFKRNMEIQLLKDSGSTLFAWLHIYDRKIVGSIGFGEGFQNQSLAILEQEENYNAEERTAYAYPREPLRNTAGSIVRDYMVRNIPNNTFALNASTSGPSASGPSASGPSASTDIGSATCPPFFDQVPVGNGKSVNYSPDQFFYEEKVADTVAGIPQNGTFLSSKECENKCTGDCIAYTFNSLEKSCKTYTNLGSELKLVKDTNSYTSILANEDNPVYGDLQKKAKDAIDEYKKIKEYLVNSGLYSQLFIEKTGLGIYDYLIKANPLVVSAPALAPAPAAFKGIDRMNDPRLDREIENDLAAVKLGRISLECLNGIYKKYSLV